MKPHIPIGVIGAGIGGLCAAIRLRVLGHEVMVFEKAALPGGKMRQIQVGDQALDAGPSVLTLPWVFDELFGCAGKERPSYVRFRPLSPACRHFFQDGVVLDLYNDEKTDGGNSPPWARSMEEIHKVLGAHSAEQYHTFRTYAETIYKGVLRPFLLSPLPGTPFGIFVSHKMADAMGFLRLDAWRTVHQSLCRFFEDPHLRVLFGRYATYCGSDPFRAPATLNVIPHVELGFGMHQVDGGMYRLVEALQQVALEIGVKIETQADVEEVEVDPQTRRVVAVHVAGKRILVAAVVANCDVGQLFGRLLKGFPKAGSLARKVAALEPSLSAHLLLCATRDASHLPLCHHNVFFSADYPEEFQQLATHSPLDPTVYLCNSQRVDRREGSWFFLVNAPALVEDRPREEAAQIRTRIARALALHQINMDPYVYAETSVHPSDFANLFPFSQGALYGSASNSRMSAFLRPQNRVPGIFGLYCVGGSTHPGAGVPMVALSAQIVSNLIRQDLPLS